MASLYVDLYRPWPGWVVKSNEEIAVKFGAQIGTYRGHADKDPGHDMTGDLAADFWLYVNTKDKHDQVLAWFQKNAVRIGAIYIITWRRIWSVARADEGVRAYPLASTAPHTDHIHISYGTTPPEDDMALSDDDIKDIWVGSASDVIPQPTGTDKWQPGSYLRNIYLRVDTLEAQLAAQGKKLDAILAAVQPTPEP